MTIRPDLPTNETAMHNAVDDAIARAFPVHPFEKPLPKEGFNPLLAEYLGMSVAFPYLQAGAQKDIIFHHIRTGTDVSLEAEITLAVSAFLAWDETGGNYRLLKMGMEGLPGVLETRRHFHSALLRDDLRKILGHDVKAAFSPATRDYLGALYEGLASANPITRVAYMVSFESHAERMIMGLWSRIAETFPVQKDDLTYFHAHVGGDDPAEAYHVATTAGMIAKIVPVERFPQFLSQLTDAYSLHVRWCEAIRAASEGSRSLVRLD